MPTFLFGSVAPTLLVCRLIDLLHIGHPAVGANGERD